MQACLICKNPDVDRCHVKSRGSGGGEQWWNILYACRFHHSEQHSIGWKRFCDKYPVVAERLNLYGWGFNEWGKLIRL